MRVRKRFHSPWMLITPALGVFLLMVSAQALLPLKLQPLLPPLILHAAFFWAIFRPDVLPGWAIFFLGIITDILMGLPMGVCAMTALMGYAIARSQGHGWIRLPFTGMWLRFCLWLTALTMWLELVLTIYHQTWFPPMPLVTQALVGMIIYPPLHWLQFTLLTILPHPHD
jgi:rod shape-determining protein MreD